MVFSRSRRAVGGQVLQCVCAVRAWDVRADPRQIDGIAPSGCSVEGWIALDGDGASSLYSELALSAFPVDIDRSPTFSTGARAQIHADLTFGMAGINGPRLFRLMSAPRGWA